MTVRLTHWRGPLRCAAFAALIAALPPLPLAAASDPAPAAPTTMHAAVHAAAVKEASVVAVPRAPRAKAPARTDQQATPAKQSTGFFRSGAGAVALAVMVVGTGYALYSTSHDRITSPAKK